MQWALRKGYPGILVRCRYCADLFGMDIAGVSTERGREAVMPDGRPCRSIDLIVQDA